MNFYTAKRLLTALGMTIQRHEGTFGSIELDVRRRATGTPQYRSPGASCPRAWSSKPESFRVGVDSLLCGVPRERAIGTTPVTKTRQSQPGCLVTWPLFLPFSHHSIISRASFGPARTCAAFLAARSVNTEFSALPRLWLIAGRGSGRFRW